MEKLPPLPNKRDWFRTFMESDVVARIKADIDAWQQQRPFLFTVDEVLNFENSPDLFSGSSQRMYVDKAIKLVTFYYIDYIANNVEGPIYDFGCGDNIYSRFYPIIGVDPMSNRAQVRDFFDEDYAANHPKEFNAAVSVCGLHYVPITRMRHRIESFASIIRDGGLGYVSMNMNRLLDNTPPDVRKNMGFENLDNAWSYVRSEIDKLKINVIHYETIDSIFDEGADGNIRILFQTGENR